jgi:hypothetical protein
MKRITNNRALAAACPVALLGLVAGPAALADDTGSLAGIVQAWTPIADVRLRYEDVGQVPLAEDAQALTLRARLGFQTTQLWDTALLAEGNFLIPIDDRYRPDNAVATPAQYPVVADPRDHELNRLALLNKSLPDTTVTLGRQRIQLDDQRFIGNVGWRQDEQTFDAVRVVNTSLTGLTFDVAYLNRVHRVYDDESPQGTYRGGMTLANVSYQIPVGKLTGFAYLLSFDPLTSFPGLKPAVAAALNPALSSTSTYGGRFAGDHAFGVFTLGYVLSYAAQQQRGDNPQVFTNDYYLGELSGSVGQLKLTAGDEVMQGNGTIGFATPLATTHSFDGWADKFLTTPANGLENRYLSLAYQWQPVGPLHNVIAKAIYRSFAPQHISGNYGSEWDFQLSAKWQRFTPAIMFADYRAAGSTPITIARDTKKLFMQVEFSL